MKTALSSLTRRVLDKLNFLGSSGGIDLTKTIINYSRRKNILRLKQIFGSIPEEHVEEDNLLFQISSDDIGINRSADRILFQNVPNLDMRSKFPHLSKEIHPEEETRPSIIKRQLKELSSKQQKEYLRKIVELDDIVIRKIYKTEFPPIARMVKKHYDSSIEAEDVFQNAMVILIEKIHKGTFSLESSIGTYLYSISNNLCKNITRTKKRRTWLLHNYTFEKYDFINFSETDDTDKELFNLIESMGDPCQKLLEYFYYRKLPFEQIAEQLGYKNADSAKNQKYKCIQTIKQKFNIASLQ